MALVFYQRFDGSWGAWDTSQPFPEPTPVVKRVWRGVVAGDPPAMQWEEMTLPGPPRYPDPNATTNEREASK